MDARAPRGQQADGVADRRAWRARWPAVAGARLAAVLVALVLAVSACSSPIPPVDEGPRSQCETATPEQPNAAPSKANALAPPLVGSGQGPHPYYLDSSGSSSADSAPMGRWRGGGGKTDPAFLQDGRLEANAADGFYPQTNPMPRIVFCESLVIAEPITGSCSYVQSDSLSDGLSGTGQATGPTTSYPQRSGTFRYLVYEAHSSRLLERFDIPTKPGCPSGFSSVENSPVDFVVGEQDSAAMAARMIDIINRTY